MVIAVYSLMAREPSPPRIALYLGWVGTDLLGQDGTYPSCFALASRLLVAFGAFREGQRTTTIS